MKTGVLLLTHGTVDGIGDLPSFLTNIRRGHAPPESLVKEITNRYEAIGGRSPLNDTTARLATKVGDALGLPARFAARLWRPTVDDQLRALAEEGCTRIVLMPLAQFSSPIYADHAKARAAEVGLGHLEFAVVPNWGADDRLHDAFVRRARAAIAELGAAASSSRLLVTAHSLPVMVVRAGDPYEREFRAAAERFVAAVGALVGSTRVVFQSQGQSTGPGGRPMEWLGPDLPAAIAEAKAEGVKHLLVAPIGFLADHVEILYDLDIEAKAWAAEAGMGLSRTASLNDDDDMVQTVVALVRRALA
jgi:protoporphyrin/coproporphyrin ferrochelatase